MKTCFSSDLFSSISVCNDLYLDKEVAQDGCKAANTKVGRMNMGLFTFVHLSKFWETYQGF